MLMSQLSANTKSGHHRGSHYQTRPSSLRLPSSSSEGPCSRLRGPRSLPTPPVSTPELTACSQCFTKCEHKRPASIIGRASWLSQCQASGNPFENQSFPTFCKVTHPREQGSAGQGVRHPERQAQLCGRATRDPHPVLQCSV